MSDEIMKYSGTYRQYLEQLRRAEEFMLEFTQKLEREGYVNTIHDCWEKIDELPDNPAS
jgi:hypothetical protein